MLAGSYWVWKAKGKSASARHPLDVIRRVREYSKGTHVLTEPAKVHSYIACPPSKIVLQTLGEVLFHTLGNADPGIPKDMAKRSRKTEKW